MGAAREVDSAEWEAVGVAVGAEQRDGVVRGHVTTHAAVPPLISRTVIFAFSACASVSQ